MGAASRPLGRKLGTRAVVHCFPFAASHHIRIMQATSRLSFCNVPPRQFRRPCRPAQNRAPSPDSDPQAVNRWPRPDSMPRIQALRVFKNLITSSDHKASAEPYASLSVNSSDEWNRNSPAVHPEGRSAKLPGGLRCSQPRVFAANLVRLAARCTYFGHVGRLTTC
jgi:hypothetical protein